jgi:GTP-binding protein
VNEEEKLELIERARKVFSGASIFLSAPALKFLPDPVVPEIAFRDGRTWASSLLNAITGRKSLARTSVTPGRTQELNFSTWVERWAKCPISVWSTCPAMALPRPRPRWWSSGEAGARFLRGRVVLKRALVLIDSRHGVKPPDLEMMEMLDGAAVGYRLILTKADKVKASELTDVHAKRGRGAQTFGRFPRSDDHQQRNRPWHCRGARRCSGRRRALSFTPVTNRR